MTIIHIVLFKFQSTLSGEEVKDICDQMLSLKSACVDPQSSKPYIVQSSGGQDNSPEGFQGGFTHGFVVEFASKKDRDYYVKDDPAHHAFVQKNKPRIDDIKVIDYEVGVY